MPNEFMYDLVADFITDGNAKLYKYKSRNSGLIVCICQVNGPLVGGYLTVATEAFDDDGLPHTLEHLVFLGSEKYPYKGVLDMIASRCLAPGTNAFTDVDHTCYTVTTAGDEGFLKILPIYLDHLLFPTLKDSAFTTEVHHINGEGEDAGVVYCEMQARENSDYSLCFRAMAHALYPGHCGYKSEVGGLMKNLRESTTNEKVRAYHKEFYRPENLCCIIVGQVEPEKVFEALIPVEERILQEGERDEFVRPWQTPVPPLMESVTHEVQYPTDEEEFGMLLVSWRGPEANDAVTSTALSILLDYLTETSVAPLNREFVEIDDPLCSDVNGCVIENSAGHLYLNFSSVPTERLKELEEKVFSFLRNIADGKEEIDMQRLTTLIKRRKLYILSSMEDNPHNHMSSCLVKDFLYGHTLEDLENRIKEIPRIEKLLEADVQFWVTLLRTYMVDGNHVVILGIPSKELSDKMSKAEKERVEEQKVRLGPDGLEEKAEVLKKSIEANDIPPPKEMISSITVPSVKSITFHPLKRTCNVHEAEGDDVPFSINSMPCRFQVDCVQTNFVRINFNSLQNSIMPNKFKYDLVAELITDGNAKLYKYKSRNSGLIVCICQVNGPLVGGYLTVATEAFDDDGLPHTLEHLVFLGSEKYPYKGVLDMIASRCLAQGTNAWTDVDHTCYTVTTAGDEGFLKILPIYLDHLLFPTLKDGAFTTEVHHINGEGEDAGVVYCEMQARENSDISRCFRAMSRALYPGHCGYKSEVGGMMKNLRESTTNEKVRAYHKEFYRPENLCCIIVGQVEPEKVFEALIPVEERILQEGERGKFVRPWQTPVPPLTESVTHEVQYPTDEEEFGMLLVSWRGPEANDAITITALSILLDYLTDTSVAPLNREFVEIDDPLCNDVSYSVTENSVGYFYLHFSSVPTEQLKELEEKVFIFLRNIADGKEEIDMQRLTTLIKKRKLYILSTMEDDPHDHMSSCLIGDFLYGHTLEDLENRIKEIPRIEKLLEADVQFWVTLLRTYMVDGNHVVILGIPSKELSDKMSKAEKERVKEQKERLGPDGLKEKAEVLKKSVEANEIPPPKEMLSSITVPSVKSIKFHPLKRTCNVREAEGDDVPYSVNKMPCRFQVDCVQTNFVRLYVLIDTSHLSLESRMYLPLLIELLDECAVERNGEIVPYEDVIKQIAEDTISIDAGLGLHYKRFFCTIYSQAVCLCLMVEEEKYEKSVQWVREILYQLSIEPSRIKSGINKMVMDVPAIKQSGSAVVKSMMKNLCFKPESNHWTASIFRQHVFLNKLQKQLEKNPDEVVAKLNEIRENIGKPDKMIVHLSLNLDSMKKKLVPEEVWLKEFLPSSISPGFMDSNLKKCSEYIQPIANDCTKGLIAGIGSVESTYLLQSAVCNIENISDYASLLVLIDYFTQTEGPMYRQIRGCGYAYGYDIYVSRDTGLIYFGLYRATHPVKGYKAAVDTVESLLNGNSKWNTELLESARSTLMFELIEKIKTVADVVSESLKAYCRDTKSDVNKELNELLEKASVVTTSDMERVGLQYIKPLFNPELSRCAITCNPTKVNEIKEEFEKLSRKLTVVPSLEKNFMCEYQQI